jgi:hypothetical protein
MMAERAGNSAAPAASPKTGHLMTESTPEASDAADPRVETLERRIVELEAAHRDRLIRSELKAEAVRAGMIDLDGLKLLDPATVELGEDGEVKGGEAAMRNLKRAKPWLFGLSSTSSTAAAPSAQPPAQKLAKDMTHAEWLAAKAELTRRR